jgi:hypothetical protein
VVNHRGGARQVAQAEKLHQRLAAQPLAPKPLSWTPQAKESANLLEIEAKAFVVATGGFSSSAFLLSQGLGGSLPVLGKFIAMNPSPIVHALYRDPVVQWRNIPAGFGIDHFGSQRTKTANTSRAATC